MLDKIEYKYEKNIGPVLSLKYKNKRYGICFCHKIKDRCIKFFWLEKFLCSRCLGILFGGIIASTLHFLGYYLSFVITLILVMPMLIDGFSQYFGFRYSNNVLRVLTGTLFGIGLNYMGVIT